MTCFRFRQISILSGLVALGVLSVATLRSQEADELPVMEPPNKVASSVPMPALPVLKSPVDQFRELLAMRVTERRQALTNRTPEAARKILAKVREYESLKPEERELRLRATELRWYLLPLMTEPGTNRAERLAMIPEDMRKLVEERLEQWTILPPTYQEDLLNNELTARYFAQLQVATTDQQRSNILKQLSPERRAKLEAGLDQWRKLSEADREKTLQRFTRFFELTDAEKEKALKTISDDERHEMEKTLEAYGKLTPNQRARCIRSFEKFTSMSIAERQQFLKNAERWKLMSPDERDAWRNLVVTAPLYPPEINTPPLPRPPMVPRRILSNSATN
jgi:hypothetical protein